MLPRKSYPGNQKDMLRQVCELVPILWTPRPTPPAQHPRGRRIWDTCSSLWGKRGNVWQTFRTRFHILPNASRNLHFRYRLQGKSIANCRKRLTKHSLSISTSLLLYGKSIVNCRKRLTKHSLSTSTLSVVYGRRL